LKLNVIKAYELIKNGSYNLFSGAAMFVGQKVDIMIIGAMLGLSIVGAYSLYLYIATVIYVPMRALSKITVPLIAESWKNGDIKQITEIYKRTSLLQLIWGVLIYIGVIINNQNLFAILKKPEYIENFNIFYFIGLAILIDVAVGLNSEIIASSKYYRYDALFNVILLLVSILANILFIPIFGGLGAAIASATSFFIFNFIKWLFLFMKFKMQPLNLKQVMVLVFGFLCLAFNYCIPKYSNIYIDILIRSTIISTIYLSALYFSNISSDLNDRIKIYKNIVLRKKTN
jgi:O-antigen/teichoic acid export membrane protein